MGAFIAKQPNGLYCRFSTVVDCPTDWNMTEEDYIEMCAERARADARKILTDHLYPFDMVRQSFIPVNMTADEFKECVDEMTSVPKYTCVTGKEPLILEPEDYPGDEWSTILKIFGLEKAERIVVSDYTFEARN